MRDVAEDSEPGGCGIGFGPASALGLEDLHTLDGLTGIRGHELQELPLFGAFLPLFLDRECERAENSAVRNEWQAGDAIRTAGSRYRTEMGVRFEHRCL